MRYFAYTGKGFQGRNRNTTGEGKTGQSGLGKKRPRNRSHEAGMWQKKWSQLSESNRRPADYKSSSIKYKNKHFVPLCPTICNL